MTEQYDFSSPTVDYNDETSYRAAIRKIFRMKDRGADILAENPDLDELTRDELNFDTEAFKIGHDNLFVMLKDNLLFYDICVKAASFMLSEDPEIGLCILFSYDYFKLFYLILVKYSTVDINDADYKILYADLYR
jgi:hypothetical protein